MSKYVIGENAANAFKLLAQKILGDNYYVGMALYQFDPQASYQIWVACKKHKTYKSLDRVLDGSLPAPEELLKAAQSCEGCIADHAAELPPTRWPEGAEL